MYFFHDCHTLPIKLLFMSVCLSHAKYCLFSLNSCLSHAKYCDLTFLGFFMRFLLQIITLIIVIYSGKKKNKRIKSNYDIQRQQLEKLMENPVSCILKGLENYIKL